MSLLDKKLYLADLEERLNTYMPANDVRRIMEVCPGCWEDYMILLGGFWGYKKEE